MKTETKYAIFAIPTKEAKLFANAKPEIVSKVYELHNNELTELCENFNQTMPIDELIQGYSIRKI